MLRLDGHYVNLSEPRHKKHKRRPGARTRTPPSRRIGTPEPGDHGTLLWDGPT